MPAPTAATPLHGPVEGAAARLALGAPMRALMLAFAVMVLAGFPAALWFQSMSVARPLAWLESAAFILAGGLVVLALRWPAATVAGGFQRLLARLSTGLLLPVIVGAGLRLVIACVIHPKASSDGATYLGLAERMANGLPFSAGGDMAYWPPGAPLAMTPIVYLLGTGLLAMLVYGLICFVAAACGAWQLARRAGLGDWASVPVWLLALWPTHVLCTGLPEKELLVIALMPWILVFAFDAVKGSARAAVAAGVLLGGVVLVQPSLQLLPVLGLGLALAAMPRRLRTLGMFALMAVAMLATISPWTYRNYQVLGEPVLISSNGGSNLYRANNELATGGYIQKGKVDLDPLGELEGNRVGKRLAVEWITGHPLDFARLTVGKMLLFSGDDSYGAYAAVRRGMADVPSAVYQAIKLLAALPWLLMWAAMAAIVFCHARLSRPLPAAMLMLLAPYAYLFSIHSIFESTGKYHLSALVPTLVLAVLLARSLAGLAHGRGRQ